MNERENNLNITSRANSEGGKFVLTESEEESQDDKPDPHESDWDGTESEFVEDDDAEEYEEKYSGIKLSYSLKREEITSCLKHVGFNKNSGTRQIVELCLLTILVVMFFVMYSATGLRTNLVLAGFAILTMVLLLVVPAVSLNINAEKMTTGRQLDVEIYPDSIEVYSGSSKWEIPMDGSSQFEEFNKMLLVYMPQEKIFIIPIRAIEPDFLADVQAMIVAGTSPKTDD